MEQIIEMSETNVNVAEEQQVVELPVNLLEKVGGGIAGIFL
jgi:hypothetical protein